MQKPKGSLESQKQHVKPRELCVSEEQSEMHKLSWEPHAMMEQPSGETRELREPREHVPKEPEQQMPEPRGAETREYQLELPLSREQQPED
eukprot:3958567-Ditylum_brightwellii.AAC.1